MIHAYDEDFLPVIQEKIAIIFEIAVLFEKIEIDKFMDIFTKSDIVKRLEVGDSVISLGKSANELLALIIGKEPKNYDLPFVATPEYWVGYVISYIQWFYNVSYKKINDIYKMSDLIKEYFPYHDMDINHMVDFFKVKLNVENKLKKKRIENNYTQEELSLYSGISIRTIRAYEQETLDISKASCENVYILAKVLNCNIEDLIKY